jgi:hypothetical protein
MGFVLDYQLFFKVSVVEEGSGSPLKGFFFSPTSRCVRLLSDHQLIFRARETGFSVYFATNPRAADPLMGKITRLSQFGFAVRLKDSTFFNRYAPDPAAMPDAQFYFDNLLDSGDIQLASRQHLSAGAFINVDDAARIHPHVFFAKADLSGGTVPTKHLVKEKFDPSVTVKEVTIDTSSGASLASTRIDLSDQPSGPYLLDTDAVTHTPQTIYLDNALAAEGNLGIIDIFWETPQDTVPAGGLNYTMTFNKQ